MSYGEYSPEGERLIVPWLRDNIGWLKAVSSPESAGFNNPRYWEIRFKDGLYAKAPGWVQRNWWTYHVKLTDERTYVVSCRTFNQVGIVTKDVPATPEMAEVMIAVVSPKQMAVAWASVIARARS